MWRKTKGRRPFRGPAELDEFDELAREFAPVVFRYVRMWTGTDAEAEDLTQEAFVRAFERWHQLRQQDRFLPWVLTIARHTTLNDLRRPYHKREVPLAEESERGEVNGVWHMPAVDGAPDPRSVLHRQGLATLVDDALDELDPVSREVFVLRYYGELRTPEVARRANLPLGTVTAKLCRGMKVLRRKLEASGVSPEDLGEFS